METVVFFIVGVFRRGGLNSWLYYPKGRCISLAWQLPMICRIASGLAHLHSRKPPILHGDLKPGNILLAADMTPKICDFAFSRFVQQEPIEHPTGREFYGSYGLHAGAGPS